MIFQGLNNRITYLDGGVYGVSFYLNCLALSGVNIVYIGSDPGSVLKQTNGNYNTVFVDGGQITPELMKEHSFRTELFVIEKRGPLEHLVGRIKDSGLCIPVLFVQRLEKKGLPNRIFYMDTDLYFYTVEKLFINLSYEDRLSNYMMTDLKTGLTQDMWTYHNVLKTRVKIAEYMEQIQKTPPTSDGGPGDFK
jgi:hypothetical protein